MSSIVVMTEGGLKSAVAAATCRHLGKIVFIHVDYGQPAAGRGWAATQELGRRLPESSCYQLHVRAKAVKFDQDESGPTENPFKKSRSGSGKSATAASKFKPRHEAFPLEASPASPLGFMGVVPALLSWGARMAIKLRASRIVTGISQAADEPQAGAAQERGRPDHRREFIHAMNLMLETALLKEHRVPLEAPLIDNTYAEIIQLGARLHVPFEATWSCREEGEFPCQQCDSCKTRLEAFAGASLSDPLQGKGLKTAPEPRPTSSPKTPDSAAARGGRAPS